MLYIQDEEDKHEKIDKLIEKRDKEKALEKAKSLEKQVSKLLCIKLHVLSLNVNLECLSYLIFHVLYDFCTDLLIKNPIRS